MPVISRVLRHLDIETDTFFLLCGIDLHAVSPGTTRILSAKELIHNTTSLGSQQQDRLRQLAQRIDNLSSVAGQEILLNLGSHKANFSGLRTPQDKLVRLYKDDRKAFRKAEAVFYVDEYREKAMVWSGYRLPTPVALQPDSDLSVFQARLEVLFGNDVVVIQPYERYRHNKHGSPVRVLQFMIYREGVGVSIDVVNRETSTVESDVIYPARLYGVVYEPETGVLEFYGKQQALRDQLRTAFCDDVLSVPDQLEPLVFRKVSLDGLRIKQDLAALCSLKHGVRKIAVKTLSGKVTPDNEPLIFGSKPRQPFGSDVYSAMEKVDVLPVLSRDNFVLHSATLVILCEAIDGLPDDTITLTLTVPHTCDLPDNTLRNKYIIHELLVELGLIKELIYG